MISLVLNSDTSQQPEKLALTVEITESTYTFPSETILNDTLFRSMVDYQILQLRHHGYYVISVDSKTSSMLPDLSTLIFKVGKLPKPDLTQIGIKS